MYHKQILKFLLGKKFSDIIQATSVIENPSIMTATGWRINNSGKAIQDKLNDKDVILLRNNLKAIGEAGITAPTLVNDIKGGYNIVRHPVLTWKAFKRIPSDIKFFLKEKNPIKIYHGSRKKFPLWEGKKASRANFGLHVTPNKEIAEKFGNILSGYISLPDMMLIDNNGGMDYTMFPNIRFYKNRGYLNLGNNSLRTRLLKKYGGNPFEYENNIYLTNDVSIPMTEFWKDAQKVPQMTIRSGALQNNEKVADILYSNGKRIILYNNAVEYPGGISYIVTNPAKSIHTINEQLPLLKYPLLYEIEKKK